MAHQPPTVLGASHPLELLLGLQFRWRTQLSYIAQQHQATNVLVVLSPLSRLQTLYSSRYCQLCRLVTVHLLSPCTPGGAPARPASGRTASRSARAGSLPHSAACAGSARAGRTALCTCSSHTAHKHTAHKHTLEWALPCHAWKQVAQGGWSPGQYGSMKRQTTKA